MTQPITPPADHERRLLPRRSMLRGPLSFALFSTSYTPLFMLIVLRQLAAGSQFLHWGGLTRESLQTLLTHFGVSIVLGGGSIVGALGLLLFTKSVAADAARNGARIAVAEVRNRNSESISYIGTYIIPFLFEDYSSPFSVAALAILLCVIYAIYVNSTLVLINPLLNLVFSLYEVEYTESVRTAVDSVRPKTAMLIVRDRFLEEGDGLLVRSLGRKLFFAVADA